MKRIITCLAAGLLVIGAQSLMAEDAAPSTTNSVNSSTSPEQKHREATPEQRKERQETMKLLGLSKEDLKGLSHQEQRAKIKEAADKYVADMKAKKDAGTLTAAEQTDLDKVEKFMAHAGHKKADAPSTN